MSALIRSRLIYLRCVRSGCEQSQQGSPLFDQLVGAGEHRRRHVEAERPRGVEVDYQLELGRMHDRQVRWPGALENARRIHSDLATKSVEDVGSVADQPADLGVGPHRIDGRKRVACRQYGKLDAARIEERAGGNKQRVNLLARHAGEGRVDFAAAGTRRCVEASLVVTARTRGIPMPKYLGALTIVLLLGIVLTRIFLLKRQGIKAMKFGNIDKTDFLIPPFALFYFYVLFAAAFDWPNVSTRQFFQSEAVAWAGVLFCFAGLFLLLWSLISFKQSFRIGVDTDHPDKLIVDGVFEFSRNPIYVAFAMVLIGEFLIFPNWISLIYLIAATWLVHRQVLREEEYLKGHYGQAYEQYCHCVRRYL
jgi:protein-S-isoprenylcysteine O-methyltransferase Ste14